MRLKVKAIKPNMVEAVTARIKGLASQRQIANAVKLVESGKAHYVDATTVRVESQSHEDKRYLISQGEHWCDCRWTGAHPERLCTHRIAALLLYYCFHPEPRPEPMDNAPNPLEASVS